ncbi:hypothetical protein [Flagellimonas sp.]|uniref:hypothetical protein n=1 Tax=Flagellimonas sp. TaxID=2058762 RepID=UPI003B59EA19
MILLIMFIICSCTDESAQHDFSISISNNTNISLEIRCFSEHKLQLQKIINQGDTFKICEYSSESFYGMAGCKLDSMVVDLNNSKGYIDIRLDNNQNTYRFLNGKSIFIQGMGFQNNGNNYEFLITQQDYENAHELPD